MLKQLRPLLLAGIMTASASAASAGDPGITDTGIKLGTQAPMSGPVAMIGSVAEGLDLKFKAVNAQGGVKMGDGKTRKIDLVVMDDANEPPRTVTNARRMVEQLGVFAFVGAVGTPQNQAIKSYIGQKQVPDLFIYSGIYEWGDEKQNPWGTMLVPSFTTEVGDLREIPRADQTRRQGRGSLYQHGLRHQLPRRIQSRHQGDQDQPCRDSIDRQHGPDRRHADDQSQGSGRRYASRRRITEGGRAGCSVRGRKRMETNGLHHIRGLLANHHENRRARERQGCSHRPVREAGRVSGFRVGSRRQGVSCRLRQVQTTLRQERTRWPRWAT